MRTEGLRHLKNFQGSHQESKAGPPAIFYPQENFSFRDRVDAWATECGQKDYVT